MINNTVIVYEDDTAVRQAAKTCLESEGYTVIEASNLPSLFELAAKHSPWLLVLAEDATGLSPSQSVRGELPNPNVAILALKGWHEGFHAMPLGANMALRKPFNPQELKQFVQLLRRGGHPQEVQKVPATTTVLVFDEPKIAQYIGKVLETAGYSVRFAWTSDQILPTAATYHPWLLVLAEAMIAPDERQALDQLFAQRTKIIFLDAPPPKYSGGMRDFPRDSPITLDKPFNPEELRQVARRLRAWWEQEQQVEASQPENTAGRNE